MANTFKFGNGNWATKEGSALAYNDENNNFKPLPFDFTRAGSATRVNKDGLIEVVGSNEPRIDFLNDSKGALLLEPSRSNKVSTSNDFNGGGWLLANLTATTNQIISPDGTLNASKLEMTGDGSLRNQSEASFNDGYAYSIFVKKGNTRYVTIRSAFFTQSFNCGFDLDTLTSEANGKIEDYGNDWYRLSITKDISGDVDRSGFFYVYLPNSLGSQTSVSGNYVYAYGGQIEDGSYATSYIPTQGSSVTRVADVFSQTVPDNASFNSSNGFSVISKFGIGNAGSGTSSSFIQFNDDTGNTYIGFGSNSTNLRCRLNLSGTAYLNTQANAPRTQENSLFISCDANGWSQGANGVTNNTGSNDASVFDKINSISYTSSEVFGIIKIKELLIYNTRLTDAELQKLTS